MIRLAMRLMGLLLPFVGSMERFSKGVQMEVTPLPNDGHKTRIFDLAVIPSDLEAVLSDGQIITCNMSNPSMVVEFVSSYATTNEKNYQRDYVAKRQQYEQRQIPEYWIVEHATAQKITVLTSQSGRYVEQICMRQDAIASAAFPKLQLSPAKLFERIHG